MNEKQKRTLLQRLARLGAGLARLMAGFDDYEAYVRRHHASHPSLPLMTYEEFIETSDRRTYTKV